jgi:hypothetical protein
MSLFIYVQEWNLSEEASQFAVMDPARLRKHME